MLFIRRGWPANERTNDVRCNASARLVKRKVGFISERANEYESVENAYDLRNNKWGNHRTCECWIGEITKQANTEQAWIEETTVRTGDIIDLFNVEGGQNLWSKEYFSVTILSVFEFYVHLSMLCVLPLKYGIDNCFKRLLKTNMYFFVISSSCEMV